MIAVEIRTERLLLKPVTLAELHSTHAYASDLENTRLMMFLPYDNLAETRQSICEAVLQWQMSQPHHLEFAIFADDKHIGGITLYFLDDSSEGELGWVLHKDYWGSGYTTEAARAMLAYAKEHWHIRRMIACCDSENHPSKRVMEKLGMKHALTGTRKNRSMPEERVELIYEIFL